MARLLRTGGLKHPDARPIAMFILFLREPAADDDERVRDLIMGAADRMLLDERGRSLAESAGVDAL